MEIESIFRTIKSFRYNEKEYLKLKKYFLDDKNNGFINKNNEHADLFDVDNMKDKPFLYLYEENRNSVIKNDEAGFYFFLQKEQMLKKLNEEEIKKIEKINARIGERYSKINSEQKALIDEIYNLFERKIKNKEDLKSAGDIKRRIKKIPRNSGKETIKSDFDLILKEIDEVCSLYLKQINPDSIEDFVVVFGKFGSGCIISLGKMPKKFDVSANLGIVDSPDKSVYLKNNLDFDSINSGLYNKAFKFGSDLNQILNAHKNLSNYYLGALSSLTGNGIKIAPTDNEDMNLAPQTVFSKLGFSINEKKIFASASYDSKKRNLNASEMKLFKSIKQFFNLCSYEISFSDYSSNSTLNELVENENEKSKMQFSSGKNINKLVDKNLCDFENCNIFCNDSRTTVFVSENLLFNLPYYPNVEENESSSQNLTEKQLDDYLEKTSNHVFRYMANYYFKCITTSCTILHLRKTAYSYLAKIVKETVDENLSHHKRMIKIHSLVKMFDDITACYCASRFFIKKKDFNIFNSIASEQEILLENNENRDLMQSLWQEANITNGRIIPEISLIVSIASFLATNIVCIIEPSFVETLTGKIVTMSLCLTGIACIVFSAIFGLFIYKRGKEHE